MYSKSIAVHLLNALYVALGGAFMSYNRLLLFYARMSVVARACPVEGSYSTAEELLQDLATSWRCEF